MKTSGQFTEELTIKKSQCKAHYPLVHIPLDNQLKMLKSCGIEVQRNRAAIITIEVENELWARGVYGRHSPKALLDAVFLYNGENFPVERSVRTLQLDFCSADQKKGWVTRLELSRTRAR